VLANHRTDAARDRHPLRCWSERANHVQHFVHEQRVAFGRLVNGLRRRGILAFGVDERGHVGFAQPLQREHDAGAGRAFEQCERIWWRVGTDVAVRPDDEQRRVTGVAYDELQSRQRSAIARMQVFEQQNQRLSPGGGTQQLPERVEHLEAIHGLRRKRCPALRKQASELAQGLARLDERPQDLNPRPERRRTRGFPTAPPDDAKSARCGTFRGFGQKCGFPDARLADDEKHTATISAQRAEAGLELLELPISTDQYPRPHRQPIPCGGRGIVSGSTRSQAHFSSMPRRFRCGSFVVGVNLNQEFPCSF
jgi:hypothetical protein